jgi:hypothetical protein
VHVSDLLVDAVLKSQDASEWEARGAGAGSRRGSSSLRGSIPPARLQPTAGGREQEAATGLQGPGPEGWWWPSGQGLSLLRPALLPPDCMMVAAPCPPHQADLGAIVCPDGSLVWPVYWIRFRSIFGVNQEQSIYYTTMHLVKIL